MAQRQECYGVELKVQTPELPEAIKKLGLPNTFPLMTKLAYNNPGFVLTTYMVALEEGQVKQDKLGVELRGEAFNQYVQNKQALPWSVWTENEKEFTVTWNLLEPDWKGMIISVLAGTKVSSVTGTILKPIPEPIPETAAPASNETPVLAPSSAPASSKKAD